MNSSETIVDQNYSNSSETVLRRDSRSEIDESTDDDRASILLEITRDEETKHPMDERYRECIGSRLGYDEDIQRGIMMSFYERLVKSRGIKSMLTVIPGFTVRVRYVRSFGSMKGIKRTAVKGPKAFCPIEPEEISRNLLRLDVSSSPSGFIGQPDSPLDWIRF